MSKHPHPHNGPKENGVKECGPAESPPAGACGGIPLERPRYFTGRYLTERDFNDEQSYHRGRRHFHNRLMHGWGVVCGLALVEHWNPACRDGYVVLKAGVAIDCCGREIVVSKDRVLKLPSLQERRDNQERWLFLCLRYDECLTEKVPVLHSKGVCGEPSCDHSRIREGYAYEWLWLDQDDVAEYGWAAQSDHPPASDDCDPSSPGPSGGCIEPLCPPDHCLLLARVKCSPGEQIANCCLDNSGRKALPPPSSYLTHIVKTSWPHGGRVSVSQLREQNGRLTVTFDRKLQVQEPCDARCPRPTGVSAATFVVQFGGRTEDLDFVPYPRKYPPCENPDDSREAIFQIDRDATNDYGVLEGQLIWIELRCDFIIDCRGYAVDGNHRRGKTPSGDGTEGGTFYSWFCVMRDDRPEPSYSEPYTQKETTS
jgi:hypothetical protein